jgi:hypothetical protein
VSALILAAALAGAAAAGYTVGRLRPWERLACWADWNLNAGHSRWLATRPRQAVLATAFVLTQPRTAAWAFRHRNDPPQSPPPRSPAIRIPTVRRDAAQEGHDQP